MEHRPNRHRRARRGSTLVTTVVIVAALSLMFGGLMAWSLTERRMNLRNENWLLAKSAAEAIAEYGFAQLRFKFENRVSLPNDALKPGEPDELVLPPEGALGPRAIQADAEIVGGTIPPFPDSLSYVDPSDEDNEFDPLKGKLVRSREIALFARASVQPPTGGGPVTAHVQQRLQVRDAPLFAHAIFYNLDLEVFPGPQMDIFGPVHTNGDLYVQGISGVNFHSQVTTSQNVYYGWSTSNASAQGTGNESLQTGPVRFPDRDGNLVNMKVDGTYMDSTLGTGTLSDDFRSYASNRWHGNLQTEVHGIEDYQPVAFSEYEPDDPGTPAYDPNNSGRAVIEPALPATHPDYNAEQEKQKLAAQAGLRFEWDTITSEVRAFKKDGTEVDISDLQDHLWSHKPNAMRDRRRGPEIDLVELNMGKLKQLVESPDTGDPHGHLPGFDPDSDWNGIVYFESKSSDPDPAAAARLNDTGVRLHSAETDESGQGVPSRGEDPGLTFATNNALYIRGHFNADGDLDQSSSPNHSAVVPEPGEVPVALFADSVTVLSTAWDDDTSKSTNKPDAEDTEVAAAIVSGLIPTDAASNGASSGGVHNFPRFLEKWSGEDLFIRGSLVSLYESETDDSTWSTAYYSPPRRKWGFNQLFQNGVYPPGTPLIRTYRRVDFRELSQEEYEQAKQALPWNDES